MIELIFFEQKRALFPKTSLNHHRKHRMQTKKISNNPGHNILELYNVLLQF